MKKHLSCKWCQKKAGVAILISDKTDFKIKTVTRDRLLYNNTGDNPTRRHNNCKYLHTQQRSTQIYKRVNKQHKGTNW